MLLVACGGMVPPGKPPLTAPETALQAGVFRAAPLPAAQLAPHDAGAALASYRESCPKLLRRTDASGLTRPDDWRPSCEAAPGWPTAEAAGFFQAYFDTARIGNGSSFVTGYYEPEIAGSRTRRPGFETPVYAMPQDLVRAWPDDVRPEDRTGRAPLGRYGDDGNLVPYYTRAEIEAGALEGRGLEIAWVADPVEFFFLQVQGSGRLKTPEGEVIRIGYAGQNGHAYTGIGGVMRERGLLGDGPGQYPASMQGIMQYIRENPVEGHALMQLNESWVFFRELTGDGPLGALEVPVRRESSVAADPRFVPLGAPVLLDTDRPEVQGLWIAQDTGGAIKGPNRFDSFWGAGEDARTIAGGMSARGDALLLLPKGVLDRLGAQ
ncbi:membrane-bound lytic murein transglycosylase A [Altererythrobacter atlanticus]|nr:murein transglycosylase A [Croceibacterium atlanticum]MBB5731449.1 membrane-bound lytic murein transglycosylase A [Croceibacterium atlanticum]